MSEALWGDYDPVSTVKSLAYMLGWGNVPSREVLERSLSELRRKLTLEKEQANTRATALHDGIQSIRDMQRQHGPGSVVALIEELAATERCGYPVGWLPPEIVQSLLETLRSECAALARLHGHPHTAECIEEINASPVDITRRSR